MRYEFKKEEEIKIGDLVIINGELHMICKEDGKDCSLKLLDLQTGEIIDYGFYGNINDFSRDYNLKLVCKNEDLKISN